MKNYEVFFDINEKIKKQEAVNQELTAPDIWKDQKKYHSLRKQQKNLKKSIQNFSEINENKEEIEVLLELGKEGEDISEDLQKNLIEFQNKLEVIELETLFFQKDDERNAIMTIHPGAGGTESQDWAQMLLRMYLRYAERKGFKVEILDILPGDEAGLRKLGVNLTSEPNFSTTNLFVN